MTPVTFNGCFGWLHAPANSVGGDVAVLICPGLMRDGVLAHCSLRLLGDELAAAGYWSLRFDYPGTGDSLDGDVESAVGHWTVWQQSIAVAADWLRAASGARQVILCGVRAGGTLAVLAAARRDDVAGLLLFDPVVDGQSYVRQLILEADLQSGPSSPRSEGFGIREFRFSAATVAQIAETDLRRVELPRGQRVAIFAHADNKAIDACVRAWIERGVNTARHGWSGLEPLLHHEVLEEYALADFGGVMSWLRQTFPLATSGPPAAPKPVAAAQLQPPGCLETPLMFGADARLFGMLCRPDHGTPQAVVIIVNGGRDPHYGAARQSVAFARRLAQAGIASLRMDFSGLGDSIGPPGKEAVLTYTFSDRDADIRAAVDSLAARGFRHFAVQGLCSGAYHAFRGALDEPRIATLLLVNIALFTLPDGGVLDYLDQRGRSPSFYLRKLFRRRSWATLLSGKADFGAALRDQIGHVHRKAQGLARRIGLIEERSFAESTGRAASAASGRSSFSPATIDRCLRPRAPAGRWLEPIPAPRCRSCPMDHDLTRATGRHAAETARSFCRHGAVAGRAVRGCSAERRFNRFTVANRSVSSRRRATGPRYCEPHFARHTRRPGPTRKLSSSTRPRPTRPRPCWPRNSRKRRSSVTTSRWGRAPRATLASPRPAAIGCASATMTT